MNPKKKLLWGLINSRPESVPGSDREAVSGRRPPLHCSGFASRVWGFGSNIEALIITYTILGVPYYD